MPSPCEPCKESCKGGACVDNCACKDKGCNDCSSKGILPILIRVPTLEHKICLAVAANTMDPARRPSLFTRASSFLETCFPITFSIVFIVTLVFFYCLI
ncbi:unnamed protein product [Chrysodeixis includens]|uniref:Uncharacterized protein n=1 Tax=Chrysodeixis includens TaxID=689277 RepID=A0A9N8KWY7_CHRIL|nr:unnamed protein product [Chrysodeixis includens]